MAKSPNGHRMPTVLAEFSPDVIDPLIMALIEKLPLGGQWPLANRLAWLEMMAMSFSLAYGDVGRIKVMAADNAIDPATPPLAAAIPPAPKAPRPLHDGFDFYVDPQGFVRRAIGATRVVADEIPEDEQIFDYRKAGTDGRDHTGLIWADDTTGAKPGLSLCGPG